MNFSVIDDAKSFVKIKNSGAAAGGSSITQSMLNKPMVTAQFPSQRAAAIDNAYNSSSLYNNGLLFTAYDLKGGFAPGSKGNMRSLRQAAQKLKSGALNVKQVLNNSSNKAGMDPICQILLPRSLNDNEVNSHRYQDANDAITTKGFSRVASNMLWGAIESVTQGVLADRREALDVGTKGAFQGSDKRTKMYYNTFVIENRNDLMELIKIYYLFTVLGYGTTGGGSPKEVARYIIDGYNSAVDATFGFISEGVTNTRTSTIGESIVNFFTNVEVITSPPVWFIRDFQVGDGLRLPHSTFGPAGITSVRFGKSMDNIVNTLRESPNTPIAVEIEIQFMELIDMRQDSIFDVNYRNA
ncbi:tail tube cap [Pectobacterium phage POP12]|nr:tail tube cap [Pectobacterium phage POP12]